MLSNAPVNIDIFCHVIDNFGDIGVVERFARQYQYYKPLCNIRIFIDNLKTLKYFHPKINLKNSVQTIKKITYIHLNNEFPKILDTLDFPPLILETFGCGIPDEYLKKASQVSKLIINLEYLSAESFIHQYHLTESLLNIPNNHQIKKYYFMPGFTPKSGGLILNLPNHPKTPKNTIDHILSTNNIHQPITANHKIINIFSYENNFEPIISSLIKSKFDIILLIYGKKSQNSLKNNQKNNKWHKISPKTYQFYNITAVIMPFLPQSSFDDLLTQSDFNIVRGEDSFIRAILTGKPFLWHIYQLKKNEHLIKLNAFLSRYKNYFNDQSLYQKYKKLSIEFNTIQINKSADQDDFSYIFDHLDELRYNTLKFRDYLSKKCNLMQNFIKLTDQYLRSNANAKTNPGLQNRKHIKNWK